MVHLDISPTPIGRVRQLSLYHGMVEAPIRHN